MEMNQPDLAALFSQLGLPSDEKNIAQFIRAHVLAKEQSLLEAPWWTPQQAAFLAEALEDDADWSGVVDMLATALRGEQSGDQRLVSDIPPAKST